jgi:hypothetical protein
VVLLIPLLVMMFLSIHRHYADVAGQLSFEHLADEPPVTNTVLVLVRDLHMGMVRALRFAQSLSPNPKAVYVELDPARPFRLEERWARGGCGVPLTIVIPEFVPRHWWQQALHNQTELLVKGALLFRPGIMVVDVPSHLKV